MRKPPLAVALIGLLPTLWAASRAQATLNYSQTVLASSPVAYYQMNETSGTTMIDSVAAQNGTYVNGVTLGSPGPTPPTFPGFGSANTGATLDGVNDYMDTGTAITSLSAASYSYEVWFQPVPNDGSARYFVGRYANSGSFLGDSLFANGNALHYFSGATVLNGSTFLTGNAWHQAVVTRNGTAVSVYLDGALEMSGSLAAQYGTSNEFVLGRRPDNFAYFKTALDEFSVYNTTLTATDVANHYLAAFATPEPSTLLLLGVGGLLVWRRRSARK